MTNMDYYIPKAVRDRIQHQNSDELIRGTKIRYLNQITMIHSGSSIIENIANMYEIPFGQDGVDWASDLADVLSLNDVYYYFTNILTCKRSFYIFKFDNKNPKDRTFRSDLFTDYGQPIWGEQLTISPRLWVSKKEDADSKHIYLLFINAGEESTHFNVITHEIQRIPHAGLVRCRVHLDDGLVEMVVSHFPESNLQEIVGFLNHNFEMNPLSAIEITNSDIRKFDSHSMVKQTTHEKREGLETTTSLTRNTEDGDTRRDPIRTQINEREFRSEHGVISVHGEDVTVYINRGEWGSIRFSRYLSPDMQIATLHKIKQILEW